MKKLLLVNTLILTGSSLILRSVGISFRVYISNKIGAEGMGLYQLISSVFIMVVTFATSGISVAVTRLVAEERAKGSYQTASKVLRKSFVLTLIMSCAASVLLYLFSNYISAQWLNDARTALSLKILSPCLPFIGISSCLRGYFYAVKKVIKPVAAQFLEQFIEISVTVFLIEVFVLKGLDFACAAVVLGTTVSEIASCAYMLVSYRLEKRKTAKIGSALAKQKGILKSILKICVPVAASSYVRSLLIAAENIMIPAGFKKFGSSNKESLEKYGMLKSMALPVLFFPAAFISSFSVLLIPEISEANALKNKNRVDYLVSRVLKATLLLSILIAGIFVTFSKELGAAIYNSEQIGDMLLMLAPLIPLMYLDSVVDSMMNGLNQQVSSLKYNIIDSVTRIIFIYFLIPFKGVMGFILVMYISNILNSFLSTNRLLKVTMLKVSFTSWILMPALSVTASGFLVSAIMKSSRLALSSAANLSLAILLVCALYLAFLLLLECVTKDDIRLIRRALKF